jgi:hypothetical protein
MTNEDKIIEAIKSLENRVAVSTYMICILLMSIGIVISFHK